MDINLKNLNGMSAPDKAAALERLRASTILQLLKDAE